MKQKVITVFTEGDSKEQTTWSNVPYFLTKTFENKGFKVNRVNVEANKILSRLFDKIFTKLIVRTIYNNKSEYYFRRTFLYEKMVEHKMKKAVKKYNNTDIFISTSFSYTPWKYSNAKKVLFCDWTIDYYYNYFLNRKPDKLEQYSINRQNTNIEKSDFVISLFPNVAEYMKVKYGDNKVFYLGNVINSELNIDIKEIVKSKINSNSILFIGGVKYLEGAKCLIKAYEIVKPNYPNLNLNIIGIDRGHFDSLPNGVNCFGYLDKSKPEDKDLYYKLMREGKIIINTTPKWAGFSSTVEAMYWLTPTITTPYNSFIQTFGESIKFGYYCENNESILLSNLIIKILRLDKKSYQNLCIEANKAVQHFTWDNYVDKILGVIEEA